MNTKTLMMAMLALATLWSCQSKPKELTDDELRAKANDSLRNS